MKTKVEFPIFLRDRDGWMYMIQNSSETSYLEKIDIEENEYSVWDNLGRNIKLLLVGNNVFVELTDMKNNAHELKRAIFDFAKKVRPHVDLSSQSEADFPTLFLLAKEGKTN